MFFFLTQRTHEYLLYLFDFVLINFNIFAVRKCANIFEVSARVPFKPKSRWNMHEQFAPRKFSNKRVGIKRGNYVKGVKGRQEKRSDPRRFPTRNHAISRERWEFVSYNLPLELHTLVLWLSRVSFRYLGNPHASSVHRLLFPRRFISTFPW